MAPPTAKKMAPGHVAPEVLERDNRLLLGIGDYQRQELVEVGAHTLVVLLGAAWPGAAHRRGLSMAVGVGHSPPILIGRGA
jgi:hypothetical protein